MPPIEWPEIAADVTSGLRDRGTERRERIGAEFAGAERQIFGWVRAVGADVERQAVEPGRIEEERHRERPVAGRLPAMDEDDRGSGCATACRDEPGGQVEPVALDRQGFVGETQVRGRDVRNVPTRVSSSHPIRQRESICQPDLGGGDGRSEAGPADGSHDE